MDFTSDQEISTLKAASPICVSLACFIQGGKIVTSSANMVTARGYCRVSFIGLLVEGSRSTS